MVRIKERLNAKKNGSGLLMVMILVFFLITFIVTVGEFLQNTYYAAGNRNSFATSDQLLG